MAVVQGDIENEVKRAEIYRGGHHFARTIFFDTNRIAVVEIINNIWYNSIETVSNNPGGIQYESSDLSRRTEKHNQQ